MFFCFEYTNIRFFCRIISPEDYKIDGIVVEALIEEGTDKVDDMLGRAARLPNVCKSCRR